MTSYKTRPGVVLTEIAGEYVLVAARSLLDRCPYVTQINESSAFLWRLLEQGANTAELEAAVAEEYEIENGDETRAEIQAFVQQMIEMNYLISFETGDIDEKET